MQSQEYRNINQNKLSALTKVSSVDNFHSKRMKNPLEHLLHTNDFSVSIQKTESNDRNFPILRHCRSGSNLLKQYEVER